MIASVITPITQAIEDGILTRADLKQLMQRSNGPAVRRLVGLIITVMLTGTLIYSSRETVWFIPAMFVHGIVLVHHFSLQHECCHYTAFKTRALNDWCGYWCGFVIMLPMKFFRYEHCDHHTYTQRTGRDPEMIPLPQGLSGYLLYLSAWPYWRTKFTELFRHLRGRLSKAERRFIPVVEHHSVFRQARIMAALYAVILLFCLLTNWWAPVWYWWLPIVLGEPVMRAIRMTEHVGKPPVDDLLHNTRTSLVSAPWRFLCWNMNYHAEHHYAASVPFHALPALHERLKGRLPIEARGYVGAHIDILAQVRGIKPRAGCTDGSQS